MSPRKVGNNVTTSATAPVVGKFDRVVNVGDFLGSIDVFVLLCIFHKKETVL